MPPTLRWRSRPGSLTIAAFSVCAALGRSATAEVPARALSRALVEAELADPLFDAARQPSARGGWLIEAPAGTSGFGARVAQGVFFTKRSPSELKAFFESVPEARGVWAPPLRPLLDEVDTWVRASSFRQETGLSGQGVVVGIVDTGFDVAHPDLRSASGASRVEWLIDFSREPAGRHPALEDQYGCTSGEIVCRILSRDDIDELLANSVIGDEPRDRRGHGTHVASLAAGNGLSDTPAKYVGVAPEASLVLAQVMSAEGSIEQGNVLSATEFIFDRAREGSAPAVVNISLGTDFGAHDGSSLIERSLANLVEGEAGRAMVVAAGNSGVEFVGLGSDFPEPVGTHSEVHVPAGSHVRVPLLTLSPDTTSFNNLFLWLKTRPGDHLRLALGDDKDELVWVESGAARSYSVRGSGEEYQVTLVNDPESGDAELGVPQGSAALVISGTWQPGRTFLLHLEGQASALLWVEGSGGLGPGLGAAFLPRSSKEGTIGIPASHPALIAVGATFNRDSWPSVIGPMTSERPGTPLDSVAYFSAAGPNSLGALKPDLVAPGENVVGAMASAADPRNNDASLFAGAGCGDPACVVVDDRHALASGTSMAAPIVTGAVALLMQRDPTLTSREVRALLLAGSRRALGGAAEAQQTGAGVLDLVGSLKAQDLSAGSASSGPPTSTQSRLVLASSFIRPDPAWPLQAWLLLRDADDRVTDVEPERLRVAAPGAYATSFEREAPGLYQIQLAAPAAAGGRRQKLEVWFDAELLVQASLPVAVDRSVAHAGLSARGGCSLGPRTSSTTRLPLWLLLGFCGLVRRRSARRVGLLVTARAPPRRGPTRSVMVQSARRRR